MEKLLLDAWKTKIEQSHVFAEDSTQETWVVNELNCHDLIDVLGLCNHFNEGEDSKLLSDHSQDKQVPYTELALHLIKFCVNVKKFTLNSLYESLFSVPADRMRKFLTFMKRDLEAKKL